jgi:ankyrin repeat protein
LSRVQQFAERGGDLTQVGRCGESLLHFAAGLGHSSLVRWLLDYGANPNSTNQFQETPLHAAAESDQVDCAKLLLEHGVPGSAKDHTEGQPIHVARSVEMLRLLVERGAAEVNAIDGCGDWPLKLAAGNNDVHRIRWLLQHGAEVDRTSTGETALHRAVQEDSREAVDLLLQAGANPNAEDVDGWTPLFGAVSREVIQSLRAAGADPRATDLCSRRPQEWVDDPILVEALTRSP